ncbi:hypothetical protein ACS0TY_014907 [Phlomoides rotata]
MREFPSCSSSKAMILNIVVMSTVVMMGSTASGWFLKPDFYKSTCPNVFSTVYSGVKSAIANENRIGASILRLHFHDCFVQGCDASVLLNDTSTFRGEQGALPNGGIRGLNIIDNIKSEVEAICPGVVSCADILTIAARDSVSILGGPTWQVKVGRRDSRTASLAIANATIPLGSSDLPNLIRRFADVGLSTKDMVVLSGAHTIGQARCATFRARIYNETNIDPSFARSRQANCPQTGNQGVGNLAPLDLQTPTRWDNNYYINLLARKGLLHSDQVLYNGASTDSLVESYSKNSKAFNADFVAAMIRMGDITPIVEPSRGEIRKNCRRIN